MNESATTSRFSTGVDFTCAPTRELLASSAGGQLTVVVAGDSDGFDRELVSIAGVASVRPVHRHGDVWTYTVQTTNGATRAAQYAIGKAAVHADLTLLSNTEQAHDLESVFLHLVDQKEAPA